jgi:hypothetical protein
MADLHPAEELKGLRQFLKALESGEMTIGRAGVDVTQKEIGILKREIARLEQILTRLKPKA